MKISVKTAFVACGVALFLTAGSKQSWADETGSYGWTGPYAGVALGARILDADWTTRQAFDPGGAPDPFTSSPTASFDSTDVRGAVFGGYNFQIDDQFLVGLEADIGYADNEDRLGDRIPGLGTSGSIPSSFTDVEATWDGSVRARGGFLVSPQLLVFGTAGVALQRIKATVTCPADPNVCNPISGTQSFSKKKTRVGYTVGGGIEMMFSGNWLARAEYRYSDYGSFNFQAIPPTATTFGADARLESQTHTVSVGLAYKLPMLSGN